MASIFKRKGDKGWSIAWFDHEGKRREKASGTSDKRLAERVAAEWGNRVIERQQGLVDPVAERLASERARPLSAHFDDYTAHLETMQRGERHVDGTLGYLRKLADALGWESLASIDAHALAVYLSEQAERRGTGARTFNAAAAAWRAFGRWCVRSNRLAANPLASIGARNLEGDRRRVRRDLTTDELARIIDAAERSPVVTVRKWVRDAKGERSSVAVKMNCPDRAWAYRIAAGTGFRAGEVASLTPESFDLDGEGPSVVVEAAYSKRKRRDVQPIRPDLADLLRPWVATRPAGEPVCPLPTGKAGSMLQADMEAARALWIAEARTLAERAEREASDFLRHTDAAGRVVDFHGLRVHYVSRVVEAGANVKEAMELARHSDPRLTLKTYARVGMHNLARVLDGMPKAGMRPDREADTLRATGTDDSVRNTDSERKADPLLSSETRCPQKSPHSLRGSGKVSAAWRGECDQPGAVPDDRNTLVLAVLDDAARRGAADRQNAGEGTRTPNLLIRSQTVQSENKAHSDDCPHSGPQTGAGIGFVSRFPDPTDPDLSALVAAWPTIPPAVRAGIVALVKATGTGGVV